MNYPYVYAVRLNIEISSHLPIQMEPVIKTAIFGPKTPNIRISSHLLIQMEPMVKIAIFVPKTLNIDRGEGSC